MGWPPFYSAVLLLKNPTYKVCFVEFTFSENEQFSRCEPLTVLGDVIMGTVKKFNSRSMQKRYYQSCHIHGTYKNSASVANECFGQ